MIVAVTVPIVVVVIIAVLVLIILVTVLVIYSKRKKEVSLVSDDYVMSPVLTSIEKTKPTVIANEHAEHVTAT